MYIFKNFIFDNEKNVHLEYMLAKNKYKLNKKKENLSNITK